jgi:hypothetical protein
MTRTIFSRVSPANKRTAFRGPWFFVCLSLQCAVPNRLQIVYLLLQSVDPVVARGLRQTDYEAHWLNDRFAREPESPRKEIVLRFDAISWTWTWWSWELLEMAGMLAGLKGSTTPHLLTQTMWYMIHVSLICGCVHCVLRGWCDVTVLYALTLFATMWCDATANNQ